MSHPSPIVLEDITPEDYLALPKRPYDFDKGDRRFSSLRRAADHAHEEAARTGIRQVVRKDSTPDFVEGTFWLVQAVGS